METRFNVCDKVHYFNASEERIDSDVVGGIRIIGKAIHADESGEDVCDEAVALYALKSGLVLTDKEVFASARECLEHYVALFGGMEVR